ncbi:MAG: hypothetical protein ACNA70_00775 [Brevefilum sp.]
MQRTYWPTWRKFLAQWGLVPSACALMDLTQPLLPFVAQLMFLGMPLFKGAALGRSYGDLLTMLGDEAALGQFKDYLQEAGA